jgi:hypothetical protein
MIILQIITTLDLDVISSITVHFVFLKRERFYMEAKTVGRVLNKVVVIIALHIKGVKEEI